MFLKSLFSKTVSEILYAPILFFLLMLSGFFEVKGFLTPGILVLSGLFTSCIVFFRVVQELNPRIWKKDSSFESAILMGLCSILFAVPFFIFLANFDFLYLYLLTICVGLLYEPFYYRKGLKNKVFINHLCVALTWALPFSFAPVLLSGESFFERMDSFLVIVLVLVSVDILKNFYDFGQEQKTVASILGEKKAKALVLFVLILAASIMVFYKFHYLYYSLIVFLIFYTMFLNRKNIHYFLGSIFLFWVLLQLFVLSLLNL